MQNPPPPNQGGYGNQYGAPPPPPPSGMPPGGGGKTSLGGLDENLAAMLCYLTMFCCFLGIVVSIVFFVTEKVSRLVRFHALQSLFLAGVAIAISIVFAILQAILYSADLGIVALGLSIIRLLIGLVFFGVWILCAVKAYQNQM
ncbi:MAG TPA: hypothetical protein VK619_06395, partial [Pyrinomonadaceae bacterium]|nr:hypothetical protein [Pyrinomonadaceae bacterium]